jgi:hypothetical protein
MINSDSALMGGHVQSDGKSTSTRLAAIEKGPNLVIFGDARRGMSQADSSAAAPLRQKALDDSDDDRASSTGPDCSTSCDKVLLIA